MWCVLSDNVWGINTIIILCALYMVSNRQNKSVEYPNIFPVHLSCYIGKYKHWFYLANKTRATSYSTYVISIIISVSCQWVCLYRKFLFRNTTSLHWIMAVLSKYWCMWLYYSQGKEQCKTKHIVLCLSHFSLVKISLNVNLNDK